MERDLFDLSCSAGHIEMVSEAISLIFSFLLFLQRLGELTW